MAALSKSTFWTGSSFADILEKNKGIGPGFDYLRMLLALLVFNAHSSAIVNGRPGDTLLIARGSASPASSEWLSWREPLYTLIVPAFFALSGFLVAGSAARVKNVRSFLVFRGLRIFPALTVEVTLSALLLGPIFTSLALGDYFRSFLFVTYFENILGLVHFYLPGTFERNPVPGIVNNSLWTLPPEFYCYLILAACMLAGVFYKEAAFIVAFLICTTALLFLTIYFHYGQHRGNLPTQIVVYYFFMGCFFFHVKTKIFFSIPLITLCVIVAYLCVYYRWVMLAPAFVTYVIIAAGMMSWPTVDVLKRGDYSYGIYLYHFPICQALIAGIPWFTGHVYLFKFVAFAPTIGFAVVSWHFFEKPALRLKRRFVRSPGQLLPSHETSRQYSTAGTDAAPRTDQ